MFDNLKELCLLNGTSGNEDAVREYIINEIKDYAEYHIDNLGNIIAFKKGKKVPQKKIMLDRKSTRLNSSHNNQSRMPSSA